MEYFQSNRESRIHFSIVSSDRDLLRRLNPLLLREGMINVAAGNMEAHYIIDARKDLNRAARTISQLAHRLDYDNQKYLLQQMQRYQLMIDRLLEEYHFDQNLKGFIMLRYLLLLAVLDDSILSSLTKSAYVKVGEKFNLSSERVGRNLRYLFNRLYQTECSMDKNTDFRRLHPPDFCLSNKAAILLLLDQMFTDSANFEDGQNL